MARLLSAVVVLLVGVGVGVAQPSAATGSSQPSPESSKQTYSNPVTGDFGPVFPDPSIIRARDGYWYAYATAGALPGDPARHNLPIVRSTNLLNWEYVGDVFDASNYPAWLNPAQPLWAPDIQFIDGRYVLYYTAVNSPTAEQPNRSIGAATAPTPHGPWTDLGGPVVAPQWWEPFPGQRSLLATIDPALVTTPDGTRYLFYGSFNGGLFVVKLSKDGLSVAGTPTKIASEYRYEAPYVVHRGNWYYLFASSANCCAGAVSGYTVYVARSSSPTGPYLDRFGAPILGSRPGGTTVLAQNGNAWVGTGHSAVVNDLSGQDFLVYHAYDRAQPTLPGPVPQNRKLLLDRLDWIDGWPVVRAGAGPSDTPQPVPASQGLIVDAFEHDADLGQTWEPGPGWAVEHEPAGGHLSSGEHSGERTLRARRALSGDLRIRAAFRLRGDGTGAAGLVLSGRAEGTAARVVIDQSRKALVVGVDGPSHHPGQTVTVPLPAGFSYADWHQLDVELHGNRVDARVTAAGLPDPVAEAQTRLPFDLSGGRLGLLARNGPADVDDVTVAPLYRPVTHHLPDPERGRLDRAFSDEFDGHATDAAWQWIRGEAASVADGALTFPLQDLGYDRGTNDAALLVRPAPEGEWTAETRVRLPFGDAEPTGTPQAGLIALVDDDLYVRLMVAAHGPVRRIELVKEMPLGAGIVADGSWLGPPGQETTLLRLHHTVAANGEHVLRVGSSTDGVHWTWGAAYTLPADATLRLALTAFGGGPFTARYDYLRVYR